MLARAQKEETPAELQRRRNDLLQYGTLVSEARIGRLNVAERAVKTETHPADET